MKDQKYGVEIELTGITRGRAAELMAELFGTHQTGRESSYDTHYAIDAQGRKWKAMSDASIHTTGGCDTSCEIVTPICGYEDIELIQKVVRKLKANGAKANASCGIHVHVDAAKHTAKSLWNLVNIMASKEDLLLKALGVSRDREDQWCKKADSVFITRINRERPKTKEEIERIWYNGSSRRNTHYDDSRYHALNLHSLWQGKGIEFRCFNGTTHAGKIKAYIQLCLAISNQALTQKCASAGKTTTTNDKYTFRTWLLRLGMIGDEFETARKHLLAKLNGDTAFRYGRTRSAA